MNLKRLIVNLLELFDIFTGDDTVVPGMMKYWQLTCLVHILFVMCENLKENEALQPCRTECPFSFRKLREELSKTIRTIVLFGMG